MPDSEDNTNTEAELKEWTSAEFEAGFEQVKTR
jgi:hypothetical protein